MRKARAEWMCSEEAFPYERRTAGPVEDESLPSRGLPSCFLSGDDWLQGDWSVVLSITQWLLRSHLPSAQVFVSILGLSPTLWPCALVFPNQHTPLLLFLILGAPLALTVDILSWTQFGVCSLASCTVDAAKDTCLPFLLPTYASWGDGLESRGMCLQKTS